MFKASSAKSRRSVAIASSPYRYRPSSGRSVKVAYAVVNHPVSTDGGATS